MSVVTIGETMALLTTPPSGRITGTVGTGIGGAESNVAIGLVRLGVPATWVSRVGDDAFGQLVVREIRGEGVRVVAPVDSSATTGLMVKELRGGTVRRVRYHRAGSAASRLSAADVDAVADDIAAAAVLHLTGITPALGPGPLAAVERAIAVAREAGTTISFDVNHRPTLWSDAEAAPVFARLAAASDIVFAGPEEAALVAAGGPGRTSTAAGGGWDLGEELARELAGLGAGTSVVKLGALGSLAVSTTGSGRGGPGHGGPVEVHRAATVPVEVVDAVGAGDAFVAGYLAAHVAGEPVPACLRLGNAAGGAVCRVPGDWEGLPTRGELSENAETEVIR